MMQPVAGSLQWQKRVLSNALLPLPFRLSMHPLLEYGG
jgi:hypothetical protein